MKQLHINKTLLLAGLVLMGSCNKVLDKTDLNAFDDEQVFNDSLLARSYVDYVYDQNLPVWPTGDFLKCTDEIAGESVYFEGTVQVNTVTDYGTALSNTNNYGKIRAINQFLQQLEKGGLGADTKNRFSAQVSFFRALRYFELVRLYGGVPLVLKPQEAVGNAAKEEALVPRNSTSECITQICSDLDKGIALLPGKWPSGSDWGRITSGAAAAYKGRVLLYFASPQFNPNDAAERWQDAYNANKKAVEILTANGFGLNSDFEGMWFKEQDNPEAVMVTGYNNSSADQIKKNQGWDNSTRPSYLGTGGGSNQPAWQIVTAFPMQDGKKITDPTSAYTYDEKLFYKNRDPRFNKTIAYNGATWPINGNGNYRLWTYFVNNKTVEQKASNTGFYCRKAIDSRPAVGEVQFSGTDWMEIRYAEVLLNLAEAACGINNLTEAYDALKQIRKRAGIEEGADGMYGLKSGMTRTEMFDALLYERQVEFAFEGKRFWDLRRWKLFEKTLNGIKRTGVTISLKTDAISADEFAAKRNEIDLDEAYANYFEVAPKVLDTRYAINWQNSYYFFALPQQAIDNNPKLEQTQGWNSGTFDPLK